MTTVTEANRRDAGPSRARDATAGIGTMVRFMLRGDRVKLPAWVGGIALYTLYVVVAVPAAYEDDLDAITGVIGGPVGRLLTGPGYGLDDPTIERIVGSYYGLYLLLGSALMSILLVVRHTRVEEQSGRAELVRANVVGPHTGLIATVVVAMLTNLAAGAAVFVVTVAVGGFAVAGSALLGAAVAAVGVAFAGVTTITVQLTEYSRAAASMAGAVLGASFILRAGGDMAAEGGNLLSWLSPLGWAQQTAPYVLDRWWPLLLLVALAAMTTATGFALLDRRDLGAGVVAVRPGRARAHPSLGTPWGLALRLQRASLIGWTVGLALSGLAFGAYADAMLGAADDMPEVFLDLFGAQDVLAGYLGIMAMLMAILVAVYAVLAVQGLRTEETSGRGEPVLATPISRWVWLGTNLGVTAVGIIVLSAVAGVTTGIGAAVSTGDARHIWDLILAHLNFVPAVLVVLGVATFLYGARPRAIAVTWAVVGYAFVVGTFGSLLDLPRAAVDLDAFGHVPQMPLESFAITPLLILVALAAGLVTAGFVTFRRRQINVT